MIRSGGGSIGNPAGFGGSTDFARWNTLRLGVELLPLFDREVIVDRIEIDGLELNVQRHADGQGNWNLPPEAAQIGVVTAMLPTRSPRSCASPSRS